MPTTILAITGSAIILLWGIAHIVPTRSVVGGFGALSADNRRIITMEWVAEGLTLVFIGLLVLSTALLNAPGTPGSQIVYGAAALMLLGMAVWTALTGARTAIVPIKICPFVKTAVAIMFVLAAVL
jgi:hypothetical protein